MMSLVNAALVVALLFSPSDHAKTGQVVEARTGDALTVILDGKPMLVRLMDIDSPEMNERLGDRSQQELAALCVGNYAGIYQPRELEDGSIEAYVLCRGTDAGSHQLETGMARVTADADPMLVQLQEEAKEARSGLWASGGDLWP
jgi:endonuclease YncB( thermonuclease family)